MITEFPLLKCLAILHWVVKILNLFQNSLSIEFLPELEFQKRMNASSLRISCLLPWCTENCAYWNWMSFCPLGVWAILKGNIIIIRPPSLWHSQRNFILLSKIIVKCLTWFTLRLHPHCILLLFFVFFFVRHWSELLNLDYLQGFQCNFSSLHSSCCWWCCL